MNFVLATAFAIVGKADDARTYKLRDARWLEA
jgi:hypothetical protein